MPGVWERTKNIFQAKANKVLDKHEDPRETLDLSYEKQLDSLQKVRRSVADVATARKRIELQAGQLQKQADKLQDQAKAALAQNNEDLAREALARRAALGEQLADLKTQHDQVSEQEEKLVATSQRLQAQVEQFRTKKETMKASYTAAEAQTKVGEAVSGISTSMGDAGAAMQRAQDKIAGMQARAGAIDELLASGALTDLETPVDDI
ncbi:MAG TPA: PspA/IM30 family protein [Acidimicrobiales bacterium]